MNTKKASVGGVVIQQGGKSKMPISIKGVLSQYRAERNVRQAKKLRKLKEKRTRLEGEAKLKQIEYKEKMRIKKAKEQKKGKKRKRKKIKFKPISGAPIKVGGKTAKRLKDIYGI